MKNILKYASLLVAAVMLLSCGEKENAGGKLVLTSDRNLIGINEEAVITVTLGDKVITEGVVFYDSDMKVLDLPDFKFSADKAGKYEIWANYLSYESETLTITVTDLEMPETPADPQPESTDFKVRALMTEFTTTGCSWCPSMKALLHDVFADESVADMVVLSTCHSSLVGGVPDPGYIKTEYETFSKSTGMPYVFCDMFYGFPYSQALTSNDIKGLIQELCNEKKDESVGIAVSSKLENNQVVAKVTVKAAKSGAYRVGAFLLEDGIYGKQSSATADWMHTHNDVIRHIDASYYVNGVETFYGHLLGEIASGKTADHMFAWMLDDIWKTGKRNGESYGGCAWNDPVLENLHMAVFVCAIDVNDKGEEFYRVVNAIDCPVNGETPYEYAK